MMQQYTGGGGAKDSSRFSNHRESGLVHHFPNNSSSSFGNGEDMHHKSSSSSSSHHQNQNCRENRPPVYNAEDYVAGLKRFCKLTGLQLYLNNNVVQHTNGQEQINGVMGNYGNDTNTNNTNYQNGDYTNDMKHGNLNGGSSVSSNNKKNKKQKNQSHLQNNGNINVNGGSGMGMEHNNVNGNYNGSLDNLTLTGNGSTISSHMGGVDMNNGHGQQAEMGLRQFSSITELLAKLKADLDLSFSSFVREFIGEPNDGVTLLLDTLKAVQLSQTNITGSLNQLGSRANHVMFKRALNDEFETLLCLKICSKSEDGALKLVAHPTGLFTVSVCMMSNYSKSRVLSLQLLARLCDDAKVNGHRQVSDAMSMLRLRFGEPVRFKFLVGMLNSYNSSTFQVSCLRFLNRFIETSQDVKERIMIQTELEEAGFDPLSLRTLFFSAMHSSTLEDDISGGVDGGRNELLEEELERWTQNYIDVNSLVQKLVDSERNQRKMKDDVSELREKCYFLELEKNKMLKMIDKLKFKCKKSDDESKKIKSNGIDSHANNEPCSLFCCCEKDIDIGEKPQRLQKCSSFKVGTDVECEQTVLSSEMHSAKLNYLYEGDKQHNNQDMLGQSKIHKSSSGASFPSSPLNDCSDINYSTNSAVLTDDGLHKLCITTTDGSKTKVLRDRKIKEPHSKFSFRKTDENNRNSTKDYNQLSEERKNTSSKNSRHLVQAYVGGSGDSGLSLEDSSSTSPSSSNKVSPHSENKFELSTTHHSPKTSASLTTRPRRSLRINSRHHKHNHVIENDEDEFIVIPSLRREDGDSSTPLTSEGSITDENEEKKLPGLGGEDNKESKRNPKVIEIFRSHSRIRRIDNEDEEDDEDEENEMFDNIHEIPIYQHYYERNVMVEEATTVGAEQISIGSLKRQLAGTNDQEPTPIPSLPTKLRPNKHRKSSSGSNDEGMVMDGDRFSSSGSNKSARSRNTSSSSKSLKQMEDEFSAEFAENEHRTVSRKSIVSRNSMVFTESIGSEEDNKNSDNDVEDQEAQFAKIYIDATTEKHPNANGIRLSTRDNITANVSNIEGSRQFERIVCSKIESLIKDNVAPPTPPKQSSTPTCSGPFCANHDEKVSRNGSFASSREKEEEKIVLKIPENLYDRVAGDDLDTGDEIEAFEHSAKENSIYYAHPQQKIFHRDSNDDIREALTSKDNNIGNTNNACLPEPPIHNSTRLNRITAHSPVDVNEDKVVMRITPRPPVRRRPKSTPVLDHVSNQLSQMMENKMREIGNNFNVGSYEDFNDYHQPMSLENGLKSVEGHEWTESNTNTLETMSAKSFGSFVRPSPKIREDDIVKRIQRHQSFFEVEHHHHHQSKNRINKDQEQHNHNHFNKQYYPSNVNVVRRAESFHHNSRSLIDFEYQQPNNKLQKQAKSGKNNRCESSMDLFGKRYGNENAKPNLHKAKSMEFLKSKLLPRKLPPPNPSPSPSSSSSFCISGSALKSTGIRNGISHTSALNPLGKCNIGNKANSNSNIGHPSQQHASSRQRSHSPWSQQGRDNMIPEKGHHSWLHLATSSKSTHTPVKDHNKPHSKPLKQHMPKNGNNDYDWRQDTPFWNGKKPDRKGSVEPTPQQFSVPHEEIIGPWQHLPHLHQRPSPINPMLSPTQLQQHVLHKHPANGWHNHAVISGHKNGTTSQIPIQNQGLFLGAMRRFSPTPYLPPNGGQKSSRQAQVNATSPSPQSIPNLHLHPQSHFAGVHPVPFSNIVNAHQFYRATQSSNATPIPGMTPHFPHPIPVPFGANIMNVGSNPNNVSLGNAVSSEKLSDRLEITELSDHEGEFDTSQQPAVYSKSSIPSSYRNGDNLSTKITPSGLQQKQVPAHLRRQQSNVGEGNQIKKGGNIFDMPSGMY